MKRLGTRLGKKLGTTLGSEAPLSISDMAFFFDARTDDYFTFSSGSQISAWVSRAGSLGSVSWPQGTSGNQPTRATAVASLGNKNAVLFDGSDDFFQATTAAQWAFLSNGTGATIFTVERLDSTGPATQNVMGTMSAGAAAVGSWQQHRSGDLLIRIGNGSGTYLNNQVILTASHYQKDTSRWRAWAHGSGVQKSYVSGSTATLADTGGQVASSSAPEYALRVGRGATSSSSMKGYLAVSIGYTRDLSAAEIAILASWANIEFGVAA